MKKQAFNPYLPCCEYIPDGEPRIFGDRLYLYGSHDKFGGDNYCENDYVCWSAPVNDLSDWKYEGAIYKKEQHPYQTKRAQMFAPDVIQGADGRYYLYYSMAHSSVISVAVCDTPAGRYEYYSDIKDNDGVVIGSRPGDLYDFDPSIFIDDDGRVYLYSGFCPGKEVDEEGMLYAGAHVCELEQDMATIKTMPHIIVTRDQEAERGAKYFEAPSVRKYNGIYYFVYSVKGAGLHYYYSKHPDKEFVYGGCIHSVSDVGINGHTLEKPSYPTGNTHGGIVKIGHKYYIFDHRLTNNSSYCRQGVAEEIKINADGSIDQVEATSCGLNGGPLKGNGTYPAYILCSLIDNNAYVDKEERRQNIPYLTQDGEDWEGWYKENCDECCAESSDESDDGNCSKSYDVSMPEQYLHRMHDHCIVGFKYFAMNSVKNVVLQLRGDVKGVIEIATREQGGTVGTVPVELSSKGKEQNIENAILDDQKEPGDLEHTERWTDISAEVNMPDGVQALYVSFSGSGSFDMKSFTLV